MLSREHRLTKNKEIERVAARGRSFFTKLLGIKHLPNNIAVSRYAVVVGLKVSKKATKRNLIKRRIREVLRKYNNRLSAGYDTVIMARPEILGKEQKEIEKNLVYAFTESQILKRAPQ